MTAEEREHIELWLLKAGNDLLSAQRLLDIKPMILDTACFHVQQAIEKLLKAFLIFKGHPISRTHNINFLLDQCANFDVVFAQIEVNNINAYAVQSRYPDMTEMPDEEEARWYYQLALHVKELVRNRIVFP